jgi:hypothetical protein
MDNKPIKSDADYRTAVKEIESLMMAETDAPEGERLDFLVTLETPLIAVDVLNFAFKVMNCCWGENDGYRLYESPLGQSCTRGFGRNQRHRAG